MSTSQIRKQWLIFSICYLLIYPLLSLMINLPQLFKLDLSQFNLLEKTIFLLIYIYDLVVFIALYKCAYKKPGTSLLNLILALGFISLFLEFFGANLAEQRSYLYSDLQPDKARAFFSASITMLNILWLFMCIRLSRFNAKLQKKAKEA
ncbi:MAG: hypothetical protein KDK59_07220 [Simkania sp.]|nr:hypothetical protein [Simkania sp.]